MIKKGLVVMSLGIFLMLMSFSDIKETTYNVDSEKSTLKWTGYHLAKSYEHNGNVKIKSGSLKVENGNITGGEFIIDMASISNNDLTDSKKNAKLVNHLKSDDFFAVEKHPEAKLVINKVEGSKATGAVTIRGITEPISFEFKIEESDESKLVASASFNIDRTKHEVSYGWTIENAMLSNEFKIDIKLVAVK